MIANGAVSDTGVSNYMQAAEKGGGYSLDADRPTSSIMTSINTAKDSIVSSITSIKSNILTMAGDSWESKSIRYLSTEEKADFGRSFGNSLNVDSIVLINSNVLNGTSFLRFSENIELQYNSIKSGNGFYRGQSSNTSNAKTFGNFIVLPDTVFQNDKMALKNDIDTKAWVVHEMGHVWQHQSSDNGLGYMAEAIHSYAKYGMADAYDYKLGLNNIGFTQRTPDWQAELIADDYRMNYLSTRGQYKQNANTVKDYVDSYVVGSTLSYKGEKKWRTLKIEFRKFKQDLKNFWNNPVEYLR